MPEKINPRKGPSRQAGATVLQRSFSAPNERKRRMAAQYDLPLIELARHMTSMQRPDDLEEFWAVALAESRAAAWSPSASVVRCGLILLTRSM